MSTPNGAVKRERSVRSRNRKKDLPVSFVRYRLLGAKYRIYSNSHGFPLKTIGFVSTMKMSIVPSRVSRQGREPSNPPDTHPDAAVIAAIPKKSLLVMNFNPRSNSILQ